MNFIANGKVPLGIHRDSRHFMQTGLTAQDQSEADGLQQCGAWGSPGSWTGLFLWGFVPLSAHCPSTAMSLLIQAELVSFP